MKANEFVKKFGWDVAKEIRKGAVLSWYVPQANIQLESYEVGFSYDDLKRLVEAHDLVELYGGLESAKQCLLLAPYATGLEGSVDALNKAIILVESCK